MNEIGIEIQKFSPKNGDIIILKFSKDISTGEINEKLSGIKKYLPRKISVIALIGDVEINCVSERYMHHMGWKKIQGDKENGKF